MKKVQLIFAFVLAITSCSAKYPGAMDSPKPVTEVIEVKDVNGKVSLANGIYDLEVYVRGTEDALLIVEAGEKHSAGLLQPSVWKKMYIRGIEVTDGELYFYTRTQQSGATYEVKAAYLSKTDKPRNIIRGGDFSMLSQVEKNEGKYYDEDGRAGDCMDICARRGMNLARLRLYNDPGNPAYYPSKQFFKGIQDEQNVLALAKRAKETGMQIELTFHYSDSWTNGGDQYKPHAWQDYNQQQLHEAVYTYTRDFLKKMVEQGTAPEYVSLGNEIQSGILFGNAEKPDSIGGFCNDMNNLASLLAEGSKAVREVCPEAKIILHLTTSADITVETFKWFCSSMRNANLDYDIIGASYYPFYGNKTIEQMIDAAEALIRIYDKDFIFMEVGFAWNPTQPDGSIGQIANNLPYEDMTPEAQRLFLLTLTEQIKACASGRILGYIYWDPIYIDAPNCGWAVGEKNVTANSALFDFTGHMLPAWDAIMYN